jgi:hypothetical protein
MSVGLVELEILPSQEKSLLYVMKEDSPPHASRCNIRATNSRMTPLSRERYSAVGESAEALFVGAEVGATLWLEGAEVGGC